MAFVYLTEASAGAPTLSGANGTLCAVLDWALPQAGWAVEYSAGNARVYRPAVGNRHRLHVNHDSAVSGAATLATIRGCENASAAATLIDPFPTVAQVANASSSVCVSNVVGTVARPYRIVANDTFVIMVIGTTASTTAGWDFFMFGDVASPRYAGDVYSTIIHVGNSAGTATTSRGMAGCLAGGIVPGSRTFWCRSVDGFIKSTNGCLNASASTSSLANFSSVTGTPAMRDGYLGQIVRERIFASCGGAASGSANPAYSVSQRGWIPNLWNPVHSGAGAVTSDDVFGDSAYNASAQFAVLPASVSIALILEITNTWSPPSG